MNLPPAPPSQLGASASPQSGEISPPEETSTPTPPSRSLQGYKTALVSQLHAPSSSPSSSSSSSAKPQTSTKLSSTQLYHNIATNVEQLLALQKSKEEEFNNRVLSFKEENEKLYSESKLVAEGLILKANEEASQIELQKSTWEDEKLAIANTQTFANRIKLDIGGTHYTTSLATLTTFPDSMLGAMFSGRHALDICEDGSYFIDRDGLHFRKYLDFGVGFQY